MLLNDLTNIDPRLFQQAVEFVQNKYRHKRQTSMVREEICLDLKYGIKSLLEDHLLPEFLVDAFEILLDGTETDGYPCVKLIIKEI